MDRLFLTILNMSLTGAFVIAAICLARLPLKKAPKIISYCLWAVAGFRLIIPFSIESIFSLIPFNAQPIPSDIAMQSIPRIDSGIPFLNNTVNSVLPAAEPAASVNPLQIWTLTGSWVWFTGVAAMLLYGVVSYIILKRKMRSCTCTNDNLYEAENIKSPFVLGVVKPNIYLPLGLPEQERRYIILHEQTHIRRRDHIIKFGAYFILCLHWFNPLVWAAFLLMGADMEMSCDERVLNEMGGEIKKDYSLSLLSMATERRIIGGSPLAFGEGGIKERLKNVLHFKKPSRVIVTLAVTFMVLLSVGFALNRASIEVIKLPEADSVLSVTMNLYTDNSPLGEVEITDRNEIEQLIHLMRDAKKIRRSSVNDVPSQHDYLRITLHSGRMTQTLFVYTEESVYIEQPYVGIYRANDKTNLLYLFYNDNSVDSWFDDGIDIRYYDFDTFIADGTRELVHPLPEYLEPMPTTQPSFNDIMKVEIQDVSMNILDSTPSGLSFYFEHHSNGEPINGEHFIYGEHFLLYVLKNGEWEVVEPIIENWDWIFNDIGYRLQAQSRTETILVDWKWCLGELPAGSYKFQKQISLWRSPGNFDTFDFTHEFILP